MPKPNNPVIRRPTPEELDDAIAHAESKGWYGLVGALLELKQLRQREAYLYGKADDRVSSVV
jgi:hypothetical protein